MNKRESLSLEYPEIASEWDKERNDKTLSPRTITSGSRKECYWICPKGHSYKMQVKERVRGRGCPYCAGKKVLTGFNDLQSQFPSIAQDWDYEKNYPVTPDKVISGSHERYHWKCHKCGYEWLVSPNQRTSRGGRFCPNCSKKAQSKKLIKKSLIVGVNDLATIRPDLISEWDYKNNGIETSNQFTVGSNQKVSWICPKCHHSYIRSIKYRTSGHDCPICSGNEVVTGFNDIATRYPDISSEWVKSKNGLRPDKVSKGSSEVVLWKCSTCGFQWKSSVMTRVSGHGCPRCAQRSQTSFPEQATYYYVKKYFHDAIGRYKDIFSNNMEIDIYIPSEKIGIEYDGEAYHSGEKNTIKEHEKYLICKHNGIKLIRVKENIDQDKVIVADQVLLSGYKKNKFSGLDETIRDLLSVMKIDGDVNTERDANEIHEQYTSVLQNDSLAHQFPDIAKSWHKTKNGNLLPTMFNAYSNKKVWWHCDKCGGDWQERIEARTALKKGCPYCSGRKVLKGFNDLSVTNPEIVAEWDYERNDKKPTDFTKGSHYNAFWKCPVCGYRWQARIYSRAIGKNGCPNWRNHNR